MTAPARNARTAPRKPAKPPARAAVAQQRAAEKEALRALVDALSDVRVKRLTERLGITHRSHLYKMMTDDTPNRPGAQRLTDAAQFTRQMAARLMKVAEEAERVAAKG